MAEKFTKEEIQAEIARREGVVNLGYQSVLEPKQEETTLQAVKKITESLNKELERLSNGPNSTTPQNSTLTVKHELHSSSIMDGINKEVMKNPTSITEWGHKSDYTTPKLAAKK